MQGLITAMVESDVLGAVDPVVAVLVGRGVNRCMGEVRPVPVVGMLLHPRAFKRGAAVVGIPTTWECVYGARVARAGVEAALAEDLVGLGHAAGAVLVVRIVASQLRPGGSTYVVSSAVRPLRWLERSPWACHMRNCMVVVSVLGASQMRAAVLGRAPDGLAGGMRRREIDELPTSKSPHHATAAVCSLSVHLMIGSASVSEAGRQQG